MKSFKALRILLMPLSIFIWCCNSTVYDIEEIEEVVIIPEKSEPSLSEDIKEDLRQDTKLKENKFNDKQVIAKVYAIQIGAFINESNADKFLTSAKQLISEEIYLKNIDGFYKLRVGNFNSKHDASKLLEILQKNK